MQKEESLSYNDYERRIGGIWDKKKRKLGRTNQINGLVRHYQKLEFKLIKNGYNKKDITDLWINCLIDLNTYKL